MADLPSSRAEAAAIVARAAKVLAPLFGGPTFKTSVSPATTVEVQFIGPVGKPELDRLIRHLEILRESAPEQAAPPTTVDEITAMLLGAQASTPQEAA